MSLMRWILKTGRNDPCPCGSGKKYKKCCMNKDAQAKFQALAEKAAPVVDVPKITAALPSYTPPEREAVPPPPPDPKMDAIIARWEEFEEADYDARIALYLKTLEEPELMDGENAYEMLSQLFPVALRNGQARQFCDWVEALKQRVPKTYAAEKSVLLGWQMQALVADERFDELTELARVWGESARKSLELFSLTADWLAYHGQLRALLEAYHAGWTGLRKNKGVMAWAIQRFADRGVLCETHALLEEHPDATGTEEEFLERLRWYYGDDLKPELAARQVALLAGRSEPPRELSAYKLSAHKRRPEEDVPPGESNLWDLLTAFRGYAVREERLPATRAIIGCPHISGYLRERSRGELKPAPGSAKIDHVLCPDPKTVERYLGKLLGGFSEQAHQGVAFFELLPAWLRFLEKLGLLDAARRDQAMADLRPLVTQVTSLCKETPEEFLPKWTREWGAIAP